MKLSTHCCEKTWNLRRKCNRQCGAVRPAYLQAENHANSPVNQWLDEKENMIKDTKTVNTLKDIDSLQEDSLKILGLAMALRDNDERMEQLLADFENGFAKGWRMAVGTCFRDALDIKETDKIVSDKRATIWTQGSAFSFSRSDTVYDTPKAYLQWDIALKNTHIGYHVLQSTPSRPRKEIIYLKRITSFTGSLGKGNLKRRKQVLQVFKDTFSDWVNLENVINAVKKDTDKCVSNNLLQSLCDIGALEKRVENIAPRFPGEIRLQVMVPNTDRSKLYIKEEKIMSQDDFVALLIAGNRLSS